MDLEQIQNKIKDVEFKFNGVETKRQQAAAEMQECFNEQLRLQGEYRSLKTLEAELTKE